MSKETPEIGLLSSTSLVVGNMIGVGIFVLPAVLASYGSISILGWIFTAAGALILAKIFSKFSTLIVNKSGGPYTYARAGFGDFIGFLVAWGYWISCWVGNGALAIAVVGALSFFYPILATSPVLSISLGLFFIWFFTWVNMRGVKSSGRVQVVTTVLKIVPLLFVILLGVFFFDAANFPEFNLTGESTLATIPVVGTLTLYAFLGIESATIPAENVKDPHITVPKATMLGALIATALYIMGTVVLFGILPSELIQNSAAPFAEAAKTMGGSSAGSFVAIGVIISGLGVMNGWILITGQVPMATAKDGLFPKIFKKTNKKDAPVFGLIIGGILSSVVMLMNYSKGLVEQFQFIVEITVFSVLVPYVFVAAAFALVMIERKFNTDSRMKTFVLSGLGFAYAIWALFGSGETTVFYGFLLMLLGIPFYVIMKMNQNKKIGR